MRLIGCTDTGCVRSENQDNYRAGTLTDGSSWGLVCDGMGGANGGRMASSLACDVLEDWMMAWTPAFEGGPRGFIMNGLDKANEAVYKRSAAEMRYRGMGTTAVLTLILGDTAHIAHVGDSRLYQFRAGRLSQITRDHSYVQELVNKGAITQEEARTHPRKNVITRALGVEKTVEPDYTCVQMQQGDILLLCSDGLTNAVSEGRIADMLTKLPFFEAPQALVDIANACGGPDNITVLLAAPEREEHNG